MTADHDNLHTDIQLVIRILQKPDQLNEMKRTLMPDSYAYRRPTLWNDKSGTGSPWDWQDIVADSPSTATALTTPNIDGGTVTDRKNKTSYLMEMQSLANMILIRYRTNMYHYFFFKCAFWTMQVKWLLLVTSDSCDKFCYHWKPSNLKCHSS
jgi:hypothetical protein